MEEWKNGRMEECDNSTIRQWKNGRMEEWKNGRVEECSNSTMEEWKSGTRVAIGINFVI
jgi:hypothetical protein